MRGGKGWGSFQGTVLWSAPEKLVEIDFKEKCDIYSLGLCIWSAVERTSPYSELFGVTDVEFIQKVCFLFLIILFFTLKYFDIHFFID